MIVPGTNGGVHVTGPSAGHEQQVVLVAESFDRFPVLMRRSEGETVGGEVSVHAVKTTRQYVPLMTFFYDKSNEDAIVRGSSDAVRAANGQQLSPGLGWCQVRVVHVKEGKDPSGARPEPVESTVFAIFVNDVFDIVMHTEVRSAFVWLQVKRNQLP